LCGYFAPKRIRIDVVHEDPLSVDLDHGQPLAIPGLEGGIPADIDLLEVKGNIFPGLLDDPTGALAEVAPFRVVQDDLRRGRPLTDKCRA
jgi:hypothetical protein